MATKSAQQGRRRRRTRHVTGRLTITAKGFGFVQLEDAPDLFIDFEHLNTGTDGDLVEAEVFKAADEGRPSGRIVRVLERSGRRIVGTFQSTKDGGKVYPEDSRVPSSLVVSARSLKESPFAREIKNGKIVLAVLEDWKDPKQKPTARIVEVVGDQNEPGIDLKIVALSRGLSFTFPAEVEKEVAEIPEPDIRRELSRRMDLRKLECITIDPDSARDFDDAISARQLPNGLFEIGVHIADVSAFVTEGSALDREAFARGTSVYFVKSAIPMLPERLSADLCSLKPGKDRLAFSVFAEIDALGTVHGYRFARAVIRSKKRFTYKEVERILNGRPDPHAKMIGLLQLLAGVLRSRREGRGSVDFDIPSKVIVLDDEGIPRAIRPAEQLESHRLVAEFMLLANRLVAGHIADNGAPPFLYRVHERPETEDVESLISVLRSLGIPYELKQAVTSEDYRRILDIIQNFEFREFVEKLAVYSMTKADYRTENRGHFGLSFEAYTHFTSPIRRYIDLVVHRLLARYGESATADSQRNLLAGDGDGDTPRADRAASGRKPEGRGRQRPRRQPAVGAGMSVGTLADVVLHGSGRRRTEATDILKQRLDEIGERCSQAERVATAAEREYTKIKSLEFLARKVGNQYEGIISGVTSFGIFVELSKYLIEGLVRPSDMKEDFFHFDEDNYRYVGKKSGKVYRLGDRVNVRIKRVSVSDRKADFVFIP